MIKLLFFIGSGFMELCVKTSTKDYKIYLKKDFSFLKNVLICGKKAIVITDSNVSLFYKESFKSELSKVYDNVYFYTFLAGEKSKNLDTIRDMYDFCLINNVDRKTPVFALGGGVCGDMAGFLAATYLRGIPFIQIPTSLLAQVDSSVGGKVGVDFNGNKNIIGAFYQPELVYINIETLKTLPEREFNAGMAEVIKYGLILSSDFYKYLISNKEKIKNKDYDTLLYIIKKCCELKSYVVSLDEKESGFREILNFGHTFGHAVETLKNFEYVHGECVALGMKAALYISLKENKITKKDYDEFIDLLSFFNLNKKVFSLTKEEVYEQLFKDKKVRDDKLNFVLLKCIGEAERRTDIEKDTILDAIFGIL